MTDFVEEFGVLAAVVVVCEPLIAVVSGVVGCGLGSEVGGVVVGRVAVDVVDVVTGWDGAVMVLVDGAVEVPAALGEPVVDAVTASV